MKRHNTSRQTVSAKQRNCNYRSDYSVAQHVLASTVEEKGLALPIKTREARIDMQVGRLFIQKGTVVHLVASKYHNRYYAVIKRGGTWYSSSLDERVAESHIKKVEEHLFQTSLKKMRKFYHAYPEQAPIIMQSSAFQLAGSHQRVKEESNYSGLLK